MDEFILAAMKVQVPKTILLQVTYRIPCGLVSPAQSIKQGQHMHMINLNLTNRRKHQGITISVDEKSQKRLLGR